MPHPTAITIGDAAGVGPEIVLRTLAALPRPRPPLAVYGHQRALELTRLHLCERLPALGAFQFDRVVDLEGFRQAPDHQGLTLIDLDGELPQSARAEVGAMRAVPFGEPVAAFAHLQGIALDAAIDDALAGRVAAICTAPLTKSLFSLAGRPPTGHTEILTARSGADRTVMMLGGDLLRVALVTTHIALDEVPQHIDRDRILDVVEVTASDLQQHFGIEAPRLAVTALNPHGGEDGTMGREELEVIAPAVEQARALGHDVTGPFPADTLFAKLRQPEVWRWDAVVCMYHDQALIPLKLMHFGRSANVTLGLPFPRTSVDHGTAVDIAGQGVADLGSMKYALALALDLGKDRAG